MTDLFVQLDRGESPVYRPGETLVARILVSAPRAIKCKNLFARLRYLAHGKGNLHHTVVAEHAIYSGEISPGQHEYKVEFPLPYGPYHYAGHYLNISWEVQAYLDIPWAIDKKGATPFALVSDGVQQPPSHLEQFTIQPKTNAQSPWRILLFIGLPLCLFALALVISAGVSGLGCAFVSGIIGFIMVFFGAKQFMASRVIKAPNVHIDPWPVRTGQNLGYRLEFTPGTDLDLNHVSVQLRAREIVVRGSGTNSTTYTHDVHDETFILAEGTSHVRGKKVSLSHVIPIPRHLPPSIDIPSNRLTWELISVVDIPNWPDWKNTTKLQVLPGYTSSSNAKASRAPTTSSDWETIDRGEGPPPGPSW